MAERDAAIDMLAGLLGKQRKTVGRTRQTSDISFGLDCFIRKISSR
jgi:hypothetical protein